MSHCATEVKNSVSDGPVFELGFVHQGLVGEKSWVAPVAGRSDDWKLLERGPEDSLE